MGWRHTRVDSYGIMLTRRFLNLLQGRLALMNRDVWALVLAKRCIKTEREISLSVLVPGKEQWHTGVISLDCVWHLRWTVHDKDLSTVNNHMPFGFFPPPVRTGKKWRKKQAVCTGDETYTIVADSVLWLYTISRNHKVWKWNQSDYYHGSMPLQEEKKYHVVMKRRGNGYPSELGVDRSAV